MSVEGVDSAPSVRFTAKVRYLNRNKLGGAYYFSGCRAKEQKKEFHMQRELACAALHSDDHSTGKLLKGRALRGDTRERGLWTPQNNVQVTRPDGPFYISSSPHFASRTQNPPTGATEPKPSSIRTVFHSPTLLPRGPARHRSRRTCGNVTGAAAEFVPV